MENNNAQLLRPAQYAEHQLLTAILEGEYAPGAALPGERLLAKELGVTRPTLRETLHRLAAEGWITIRHGKSTLVNDYWKKGGLGLLSTMARYGQFLPSGFISHLLELRKVLIPAVAAMACERAPGPIIEHVERAGGLEDDAEAFSDYDWELQALMAEQSNNCTFPLIMNDFGVLYKTLGVAYFSMESGRNASRKYYKQLATALLKGPAAVEIAVRDAMQESIDIWNSLNAEEEDA